MKSQKLLIIGAIVCMLLGVSGGAAMATGCGDGLIQDETFDGSLIIDGEPCAIISSAIQGDVIVTNSPHVLLLNNKIGGNLQVKDAGVANVIANTVFSGEIDVTESDTANVIENETLIGHIRVTFNQNALVQKNISKDGLFCVENTVLSEFLNIAGGTDLCEIVDELDE